jgi:hypothetical protein
MSTQTKPEIKLMLHTAHLAKVEAFYSALGIAWVGGKEPRYDESFRPQGLADVMGLPFLSGGFNSLELIFYFRDGHAVPDD